ncbi:MAG: hypothetical protein HFJ91_10795 [Muribaculaceae bacterium]|nr:hypothetical protein [Muribaculaceae bacterium]
MAVQLGYESRAQIQQIYCQKCPAEHLGDMQGHDIDVHTAETYGEHQTSRHVDDERDDILSPYRGVGETVEFVKRENCEKREQCHIPPAAEQYSRADECHIYDTRCGAE